MSATKKDAEASAHCLLNEYEEAPAGSHGRIFAAGEMGKASLVCVWRASDGVEQVKLKGFHKQGVLAVAFGHGGDRSRTEATPHAM
jgi:hypothetical protein